MQAVHTQTRRYMPVRLMFNQLKMRVCAIDGPPDPTPSSAP